MSAAQYKQPSVLRKTSADSKKEGFKIIVIQRQRKELGGECWRPDDR